MSADKKVATPEIDLEDMVASSDTGARKPLGAPGKLLVGVAAAWSLFQLWIASPLPYIFRFGVFNATEARSIHLAFAIFLARSEERRVGKGVDLGVRCCCNT